MSDLRKLQEQLIQFRNERDWKQFHNPKDVAISLVLEATEYMEHFQWKTQAEIDEHLETNREGVADELADVFYWLLLASHDLGIDLEQSLERKMKKNAEKYPADKARGNHKKYGELT